MRQATFPKLTAGMLAVLALAIATPAVSEDSYQVWPGLKKDVFGATEIAEEDGTISLEAPYRADDAAMA